MKLIHCADIHLGSKMETRFSSTLAQERKEEIRAAFTKMVNYANLHQINIILLSGDIFDNDRPLKKDKEFFYSVIKNNPQITFFYLRGNHDCKESYTENNLTNLKTFHADWTYYSYPQENIVIAGIEQKRENTQTVYDSLHLKKDSMNIVLMHGQISTQYGHDKININALKHKNIDYLALGHIHSYAFEKLDTRGYYAYSGCLEGRGYDEIGAKGFIEIEIKNGQIEHKFIINCCREIVAVSLDISDCQDVYTTYQKIQKNIPFYAQNIYKITLKGEISFDGAQLVNALEKLLHTNANFSALYILNQCTQKYDIESLAGDLSLRGEFIRLILQDNKLEEDEKNQIIALGIKALLGQEIEQ